MVVEHEATSFLVRVVSGVSPTSLRDLVAYAMAGLS